MWYSEKGFMRGGKGASHMEALSVVTVTQSHSRPIPHLLQASVQLKEQNCSWSRCVAPTNHGVAWYKSANLNASQLQYNWYHLLTAALSWLHNRSIYKKTFLCVQCCANPVASLRGNSYFSVNQTQTARRSKFACLYSKDSKFSWRLVSSSL